MFKASYKEISRCVESISWVLQESFKGVKGVLKEVFQGNFMSFWLYKCCSVFDSLLQRGYDMF